MLAHILFGAACMLYMIFAGSAMALVYYGKAESLDADKILWPLIALAIAAKYIFR